LLQYYAKTSELPDLTKVKIEDITNVTGLKINGNAIDVKVGKDEDCFKITFSTTDSSMTITPGANKGTVCKTAIAAAKAARLINDDGSAKTEKLGGGSIYDTTDIK
ncbi:hypothetical protein, partial [Campylobacter sp. MG1]|uniref:hypothetical protein n=1 Tax=Campylobacter sp. MG1 TaxID=2976332 RepID=UPI00226CCA76